MEKKNGVVDLSSFLLIEGSADSEADCEFLKLYCQDVIMACDYDGEHEDDAESCSCDTGISFPELLLDDGGEHYCRDSDHEADNKDKCRGKQSWCKMWLGHDEELDYMATEGGEEAENGTNLSKKAIDQMEDSLFWEICLEVGYP